MNLNNLFLKILKRFIHNHYIIYTYNINNIEFPQLQHMTTKQTEEICWNIAQNKALTNDGISDSILKKLTSPKKQKEKEKNKFLRIFSECWNKEFLNNSNTDIFFKSNINIYIKINNIS